MWSVGRKRGRLYLGSRIALLQVAGQSLVSLEHAPTLPLSAVLQQLASKGQQQGMDLSKLILDVDLSASLCKGIVVPASFNLSQVSSLPNNMQQSLSAQLPWPLEQWAWPSSSASGDLLPITTQGLMRNLRDWMEAQKIKMGMVQPLWALITQSNRARSSAIKSVELKEPDGITMMKVNESAQTAAPQAIWQFLPTQMIADDAHSLQNAKATLKSNQSEGADFQFQPKAGFTEEPGLKAWAGHWEQA